jgi:preprotein translocase subunit SecG
MNLQVVSLIAGILMIIMILLQQRGASLGAGFGSSGELHTTRRGTDKSLFDATVLAALIFVVGLILSLAIF